MVLDEYWLSVVAEIRSCEASHNTVLCEGWVLERYVLMFCISCYVAQQTVCHRLGRWLVDRPVGRLLNPNHFSV